jgi:asparagine synthase (glutamine-hydrolysing)
LLPRLRDAIWYNDEPLAHASDLHVNAISTYAKRHVTVLLSGEGSDEVLGGYVRYFPLNWARFFPIIRHVLPSLSPFMRPGSRFSKATRLLDLGSTEDFILFNACDVLPRDLHDIGLRPNGHYDYRSKILKEARSLYPRHPKRQAMYSDQHTFLCSLLDRNDRMTMGASIECRVPFLDYRLVEGVAALPSSALFGSASKRLLRDAVGSRLPNSILTARKWGFAVPWNRYFREIPEMRDWLRTIPNQPLLSDSPIDRRRVENLLVRFMAGDDRQAPLVNQLAMITLWHNEYFRRLQCQGSQAPVYGQIRA